MNTSGLIEQASVQAQAQPHAQAQAHAQAHAHAHAQAPMQDQQMKLTDVEVKDEFVALNLLVSFISLAQKRGTYTLDESAKIWECIKKFQR
jgi:hypothetical protein